ncbi:hypothetical protein [Halobacillus sp. B29]
MDIDQLHLFHAGDESKERKFIHPEEFKKYYPGWNQLYQEILDFGASQT